LAAPESGAAFFGRGILLRAHWSAGRRLEYKLPAALRGPRVIVALGACAARRMPAGTPALLTHR